MEIVYKSQPRQCGMTLRAIQSIALTLSCTNREALVITKDDPFKYLKLLREYGIEAKAKPVIKKQLSAKEGRFIIIRKIVGYQFRNVS